MPDFEEYEKLKSNILSLSSDQPVNRLMVSSSVPDEGTTIVSYNLAAILSAKSNVRVLLIEANLRSPSMHRLLKLRKCPGLGEVVKGSAEFADVVRRTQRPNLSILPAGSNFKGNPLEIFESDDFVSLESLWRKDFDYLIWDSAPVNAYAEASILASRVDGVILVVRAGRTRREVVQKANEQLQASRGRVLGIVLNRRRYVIPNFLYKRL